MVHNAIDAEQPTTDRAADVARFDGDAVSAGIVKRETMDVHASAVKDSDILTKSYTSEGQGISVDWGKVVGEPWPGKFYGESMVTILNCFGEQEIVSLNYHVTVRRAV